MAQQTTEERPGIAAAIVVHEGRVLMVRRRVSEGQLSWQFPAGEIEAGESPEEAAVRETAEETGLDVRAIKLLGERMHPKTGRLMSYTACEVVSGTADVVDTDELDALAWVTRAQIPEYVPYRLFEPVQAYLTSSSIPDQGSRHGVRDARPLLHQDHIRHLRHVLPDIAKGPAETDAGPSAEGCGEDRDQGLIQDQQPHSRIAHAGDPVAPRRRLPARRGTTKGPGQRLSDLGLH